MPVAATRTKWVRRHGWLLRAAGVILLLLAMFRWLPVERWAAGFLPSDPACWPPVAADIARASDRRAVEPRSVATPEERTEGATTTRADARERHSGRAVRVARSRFGSRAVLARMVRSGPSVDSPIVIDAGSRDGVREGDAVVFEDVWVGTVSRVSERESRVLPLAHPSARFAATLHASVASRLEEVPVFAVTGSVRYPGKLEIAIHGSPGSIEPGSELETAPGDERHPAGFRLGTARPLTDRTGRSVFGAVVEPPIDPRGILCVGVITSGVSAGTGVRGIERSRAGGFEILDAGPVSALDWSPFRRSGVLELTGDRRAPVGAAVVRGGAFVGCLASGGGGRVRFRACSDAGSVTQAILLPDDGGPGSPVCVRGLGPFASRSG